MKVGDLVQMAPGESIGLVVSPPHFSVDGIEVVELSYWDGPYLACVDDCEVVSESR